MRWVWTSLIVLGSPACSFTAEPPKLQTGRFAGKSKVDKPTASTILRSTLNELARKRFEAFASQQTLSPNDLDVVRTALRVSDVQTRRRAVKLAVELTQSGKANLSKEVFVLFVERNRKIPIALVPVIGKLGRMAEDVELLFLTLWPHQPPAVRRAMSDRYDELKTQDLLGRSRSRRNVLDRATRSGSLRMPLLPDSAMGINEAPYFHRWGTAPSKRASVFDDELFTRATLRWWVGNAAPVQLAAYRKSVNAILDKAVSEAKTAEEKLKLLYWFDESLIPDNPPDTARHAYHRQLIATKHVRAMLARLTSPFYPGLEAMSDKRLSSLTLLVKHLRPLLNHRDRGIRGVARLMLVARGDEDVFLMTRLSGAMQDGDANAATVVALFDRIQAKHKRAQSLLARFYSHRDPELRMEAMGVVARLKLADRDAQRFLLRSLESPNDKIRTEAAVTILRAKLADRLITGDLQPMLDDKNPSRIAGACRKLGILGKSARPAQKRLTDLLKHDDETVRLSAAGALFRIKGPDRDLIPILAELLKSKSADRRLGALRVLQCHGRMATPAVSSILNAIGDSDERVSTLALDVLKNMQAGDGGGKN